MIKVSVLKKINDIIIIIYNVSLIIIINFTDINLRDGFGDSTNRIMLHVMPVFLYEILNMFKPYYNKKFNFLN